MLNNGCWAWSSGETESLCYWNFGGKQEKFLNEECLCLYEQKTELDEFMSDWPEYVGEYNG